MNKNWWNQPMKRKDWGVIYAICISIAVLYYVGLYVGMKWRQIKKFCNSVKKKLNRIFKRDSKIDD